MTTLNDDKPRCPECRSDKLRLVGFFMLGPGGVPYDTNVSIETILNEGDFSMARELVRCTDCNARSTLEDAKAAAGLESNAIYWAMTDHNIKKPVVCPKCKNSKYFVREIIKAIRSTQVITVESDTNVRIEEESGDPQIDDTVVFEYQCNMQDCDGVIKLRSHDYALTRAETLATDS